MAHEDFDASGIGFGCDCGTASPCDWAGSGDGLSWLRGSSRCSCLTCRATAFSCSAMRGTSSGEGVPCIAEDRQCIFLSRALRTHVIFLHSASTLNTGWFRSSSIHSHQARRFQSKFPTAYLAGWPRPNFLNYPSLLSQILSSFLRYQSNFPYYLLNWFHSNSAKSHDSVAGIRSHFQSSFPC